VDVASPTPPRLPEASAPLRWYCLHTRPKREEQVATYLRETLSLTPYLPRLKQSRVIRRVRRVQVRPLFPRYLFCQLDLSRHYRAARYAPEVIDVVRFGDRPIEVPLGIIDGLKAWAGEAVDVISIHPPLRVGDEVKITDGPMRGLHAVIVQERGDGERVAVLLATLQCQAQVLIARSQLERAG
jgi:transcription antitermination factor NusG